MNTESGLPADVIAAIHAHRKIDAIKLLREHRNLDLKAAKQEVDAYVRENQHLLPERSSSGGLGSLAVLVTIALIVYFVYKQLGS